MLQVNWERLPNFSEMKCHRKDSVVVSDNFHVVAFRCIIGTVLGDHVRDKVDAFKLQKKGLESYWNHCFRILLGWNRYCCLTHKIHHRICWETKDTALRPNSVNWTGTTHKLWETLQNCALLEWLSQLLAPLVVFPYKFAKEVVNVHEVISENKSKCSFYVQKHDKKF